VFGQLTVRVAYLVLDVIVGIAPFSTANTPYTLLAAASDGSIEKEM